MLLELLKLLRKHIKLLNPQNSTSNIIHIELKKVKVICEQCKVRMHSHGHDRERKVLMDKSSWAVYKPRRYKCPRCKKTKTINPPFVMPRTRISENCKTQIKEALTSIVSINKVAKSFGVSSTTVIKIMRSYNNTPELDKLGDNLKLGIDEHSFRGYNMVISVRELTTKTQLGFIYPDRKENLKTFLRDLPIKDKIVEIAVDMKSSYINSIEEELPKAKIVLDHFHVIQDANRLLLDLINISIVYLW